MGDYWGDIDKDKLPVCKKATPEELSAAFAAEGVAIELGDDLQPCDDLPHLKKALEKTVEYSVHTAHPLYGGQLYSRPDRVASAAEVVATGLSAFNFTYEASPVFTLMEHALIDKLNRTVGGRFAENSDGIFVPGGSTGNLFAMLCARQRAIPDAKKNGLFGLPKMQIYTSELCHYSAQKMGQTVGIGTDNVISIPTDLLGRMDVGKLEEAILKTKAEGGKPLMILATAGTTVAGSFDPIEELLTLRDRYGMWLHVDACWGATAVFSPKYRHLVKGIEQVDSCVFSLHKGLAVPTQCAVFLTGHKGLLLECNSYGAAYLFKKTGPAALDIGDKSIQCSRRNDSLKAWMMWKNLGDSGIQDRATRALDLAQQFCHKVENHPSGRFRMALPLAGCNVCYWFIPDWMDEFDLETATPETRKLLGKMQLALKYDIQDHGGYMCTVTPLLDRVPHFFRTVFPGAHGVEESDLDRMLQQILDSAERLGFNTPPSDSEYPGY